VRLKTKAIGPSFLFYGFMWSMNMGPYHNKFTLVGILGLKVGYKISSKIGHTKDMSLRPRKCLKMISKGVGHEQLFYGLHITYKALDHNIIPPYVSFFQE
jgi:hypothetical protein